MVVLFGPSCLFDLIFELLQVVIAFLFCIEFNIKPFEFLVDLFVVESFLGQNMVLLRVSCFVLRNQHFFLFFLVYLYVHSVYLLLELSHPRHLLNLRLLHFLVSFQV